MPVGKQSVEKESCKITHGDFVNQKGKLSILTVIYEEQLFWIGRLAKQCITATASM
jgi:hypothetical protein